MNINFNGKRALVTGAGKGIGRAVAKKLAECGAQVVALSRTQKDLDSLKTEVPGVETVTVDLEDWDATKREVEMLGPIDLLVNNAGVSGLQPVGEITPDVFDRLFSVNVKAVINVTQIIANGMKSRGVGGAIVNISSQASKVALPNHAVYCATKGALDQLTKVMALELGPHKIRVNAVNPTIVMTEMYKVFWTDPEKIAAMKARIPLGCFCETEHVVDCVLFLLSDKAAMVTGSLLPIDGGFTAT